MKRKEFDDCIAYMDIVEMIIREKEAKELVDKGRIEDAIAYAMASGFKMGWDAHKKKGE